MPLGNTSRQHRISVRTSRHYPFPVTIFKPFFFQNLPNKFDQDVDCAGRLRVKAPCRLRGKNRLAGPSPSRYDNLFTVSAP
jgi:hypothetical protein